MLPKTLRAWLELARISNLPTVWTNVTAGWVLAGGAIVNSRYPNDHRLFWLLLAGSLLYTGGMILNDAADVRYDREHRKERPIPSGRVRLAAAWIVGLGMLLAGFYQAAFCAFANFWVALGLVILVLFYDLYHKPWFGAVYVMGACRVLLYLLPASALIPDLLVREGHLVGALIFISWQALEDLSTVAIIPALTLGAYIVGLTMIARLEAKGASSSRIQSVFARALLYSPGVLAAVLLFSGERLKPVFILGDLTPLAPLLLIFAFAAMVTAATRIMKQGGPAIGRAVGILLAGIALVDALAVSQVSLPLAFGFAALAPLLRLWQRWIAAT